MLQQMVPHPCTKWTQQGGGLLFLKRRNTCSWEGKVVGRSQRGRNGDRHLIKTYYKHVWILNKICIF